MRYFKFFAWTAGSILLLVLYLLHQHYQSKVLSQIKTKQEKDKNPNKQKIQTVSPEAVNVITGPCKPKENITFVKLHKTGSTTVQNILLRYGDANNLTFVLPREKINFSYPKLFQRNFILETQDKVYNILCNHLRYNDAEITKLMPPNAIYVTIIRDPVVQYESVFTYFRIGSSCKVSSTSSTGLKTFFDDPKKCYLTTKRNHMLFDLGMNTVVSDAKEIDAMINFIDRKFSLVMIMEFMEESVLLLKDLLCLSMDDVTYFTLNARNYKSVHSIDEATREKILAWNSGDAKLYQHFNKSFWEKVERYGRDRMATDVALLREKNQKLTKNCLKSENENESGQEFKVYKPPGVVMDNKVLRKNAENLKDCERRVYPERIYTALLKKKQFPEKFADLAVS